MRKKATPRRNISCARADSNMCDGKQFLGAAASSISMNWLEMNGRGPAARENHQVVSKSALVVGACIAVEIVGIRTWMYGGWLTKIRSVSKVDQGRANDPFLLSPPRLGGRTIGSTSDSGTEPALISQSLLLILFDLSAIPCRCVPLFSAPIMSV